MQENVLQGIRLFIYLDILISEIENSSVKGYEKTAVKKSKAIKAYGENLTQKQLLFPGELRCINSSMAVHPPSRGVRN